jgi:hypothetical protein
MSELSLRTIKRLSQDLKKRKAEFSRKKEWFKKIEGEEHAKVELKSTCMGYEGCDGHLV